MTAQPTTIIWFRKDLRITDNPALNAAIDSGNQILPLFILEDSTTLERSIGSASKWWLHHALIDLKTSLQQKFGYQLIIRKGDSGNVLRQLISESSANTVFWNRRYEVDAMQRDSEIQNSLKSIGLEVKSYNASLLFEPWTIENRSKKPFRVFTPFWRHCSSLSLPPISTAKSKNPPRGIPTKIESLSIDDLKLLPKKNWDNDFYNCWTPTEKGAHTQLKNFISQTAENYDIDRDFPNKEGTSKLSPHLAWGQIGPRQIALKLAQKTPLSSQHRYFAEIGWREFSYHLLYHFPETEKAPLNESFARFPWNSSPEALAKWQKGQTGYPIVDAGMRQLWATGWMHNRVRMIVASFLVKHLLQPWQNGASWFWDTLVDADLASNTMGWQWSAGCGADAAPYFRIFNPILQGKKFDPQGEYTKKWVPELKNLPNKFLFEPESAPPHVLKDAGIILGETYPAPMISHFAARNRALEAYQRMKNET